jgi:Ni/Co efflux regulator RcnB
MKKILIGAVALSVLASAGLANAQPYQARQNDRYEQTRDRQDDRYQQSRDRQDDRRDERRDRQDDRYDQRRDRQDDRADQRAQRRYNAGRYQAPRGYQARQWRRGERLPAAYRSRAYTVDYRAYGLRAPPRGYQYVRVNNDVVMTAVATGLITSVIVSLFQ